MPTESGMATAPAPAPAPAPSSINDLVLPADGSDPRLKRIETVKEELIPSTGPPDSLWLGSTLRYECNDFQQDAARIHIFTHWLGRSQPAVDLLPDARGKYWPAEAWEKRAAWGLELRPDLVLELEPDGPPLRHCLFTMHTDNLERNEHVGNHVSGDVFILRVSDTLDENRRRFYVDEKPEDLSQKLVNALCDRAAEILKATKTHDDCCQQMSICKGFAAHFPLKRLGKWIHAKRIASTGNDAGTTA